MTDVELIDYLKTTCGMNGDTDPLWWAAERLEEARALLSEAVENYQIEKDPKLWTSRVREWLKNEK